MPEKASSKSRTTRVAVASAMAAALALGTAAPGWAGTGTGTDQATASTEAALRAQAQELLGQIRADGVRLDQLDESYNAAEIHYQQLTDEEGKIEAAMALTSFEVAEAKQQMRDQAILDYVAGGGPLVPFQSDQAGADPSLTAAYAEIVSGGQKRAVDTYHAVLAQQTQQSAQLASSQHMASVTLRDINADRAAADQAIAAQKQTLAKVKGHLAVVVAAVQAAQQRAEQAAVEASLAAQHQLPPSTPAPSNPAPATNRTTTTSPSSPVSPTTSPPTTDPPATNPPPPPPAGGNNPAPGYQLAIAYARAQLGKPYQWGAAGPDSFDCSGLTMMAWEQAGVYFPHLAQAQYDLTERIPLSDLLPGDLVFFGTPSDVHHVGLYIGNGDMIDAPETGEVVSIQPIYWSDLLAGGRVQS